MSLKIGIIDTGIDAYYANNIQGAYIFEAPTGEIIVRTDSVQDTSGHGTMCYRIIKETCPNTDFFIVKIFNGWPFTKENILIKAIELCIEQKVSIINISLGIQTETISDELHELLNLARTLNIAVISSGHINNKTCFPACHDKVIGVGLSLNTDRKKIVYLPHANIEFFLNGSYFGNKIAEGTSFACAKMTGIAAKIIKIKRTRTVPALLEELRKLSNAEF